MADFLPQLRRDPFNALKVIKESNPVLRDIFEAIPVHERGGAVCPDRGSDVKKWLQNWGLAQKSGGAPAGDEKSQFSPSAVGRRPQTAGNMRSPPPASTPPFGRDDGVNDGSQSARGRGRVSGGGGVAVAAASGPPAGGGGLSRSPPQPVRSLHAASPPPPPLAPIGSGMMSPSGGARGRPFRDDDANIPQDDYNRGGGGGAPPHHARQTSMGRGGAGFNNNPGYGAPPAGGYDGRSTPPVARGPMSPHHIQQAPPPPPVNAWGAPQHDDRGGGYGHDNGSYGGNHSGGGSYDAPAPRGRGGGGPPPQDRYANHSGGGHGSGGGYHDEGEDYDHAHGGGGAAAGPCQACRQKEATIKRLTQLVNELLSQIEDVAMEARGDLTFALQGVGMAPNGAPR